MFIPIVSDQDKDLLKFCWSQVDARFGYFYLRCGAKPYAGKKLHRIIGARIKGSPLLRKEQLDHINHNTLDNRRDNLRIVDNATNHKNRVKMRKICSSRFIGVCFEKDHKSWAAKISVNLKQIRIGRYKSEIEAAIAYNVAAKNLGYLTTNKIISAELEPHKTKEIPA